MRWRNLVICSLLAASLVLYPGASAYASNYARTLMANTGYGDSDPNGVWLLNDGQFTELYFWNPVPNYTSKVVNSTLAARDNGDCVEVGRVYKKYIKNRYGQSVWLRNPIGFVVKHKAGIYSEGFMDGVNRNTEEWQGTPYYGYWLQNIGFVNGWWYGFLLERFRPGGMTCDRYDVKLWDPNSGIWTPVCSFTGTGIISSRGILGCERDSLLDPPTGTWYGTFYRSQFRSYYAANTYYYWPGAKHAPYPWKNNDKDQNPSYNFFLNRLFDARWLYCNYYEIR